MSYVNLGFLYIFKGIFIGFGAMIPGVSGGTIAMMIGVFEDILNCTANLFKNIKKSISILTPISFGVIFGAYIISYPLEYFSSKSPQLSKVSFCIITLISAAIFAKKNIIGRTNKATSIYFIFGTLCALLISIFLRFFNLSNIEYNFATLIMIGAILAMALVLPAVSFSYMLLFFDVYDPFVYAVNNLQISFLLPLLIGIFIGVFIFSKLLLKLINKNSPNTYSFVFGFVLISALEVFI